MELFDIIKFFHLVLVVAIYFITRLVFKRPFINTNVNELIKSIKEKTGDTSNTSNAPKITKEEAKELLSRIEGVLPKPSIFEKLLGGFQSLIHYILIGVWIIKTLLSK